MKQINIITGNIRAGKTTFLENYLLSLKFAEGVLQPTVDNQRFFRDIKSKTQKTITTKQNSKDSFKIGKFTFSLEAFVWAKEKLSEALEGGAEIIVVDEYGPLEFSGNGLEPIVTKIILNVKESSNRKIIIIVKETLLEKFLTKFQLTFEEVDIIRIENQSKVLS